MNTYPVSERAIIQRINRRLRHCEGMEHVVLRTYHGAYGRYHYLFDPHLGINTYSFFSLKQLEELARDCGALADWETIEPSPQGLLGD